MRLKTILTLLVLVLSSISHAVGQESITPISLKLTIYTDGSVLVEYCVNSDPSEVRVEISLFCTNYNNLVIRDEENNPLSFSEYPSGVTVDSIGASELTIIFYSHDFTNKNGPVWDLNVSSPIETEIYLPKGSAIFALSDLPLDMDIINDSPYVLLPPGEIYVSYLLSIPDLNGEAQTVIETTDNYLSSFEDQGYVLDEARNKYEEAQTLFQNSQYAESKEIALEAQETADETIIVAEAALHEISLAQSAVDQALAQGNTGGIGSAQDALTTANNYYTQGMYQKAETYANQAYQLALNAESSESSGSTLIYAGGLIFLAAITGTYFYVKNQRNEAPRQVVSSADSVQINIKKIFFDHDTIRLEDREVIKFLAENGGEVYAAEIRERFDMPRSTAWRLIRRLQGLGIIEEVRIRNQTLVRIMEEYRG